MSLRVDHPYYCSPTNYFSNEATDEFDSWAEFAESPHFTGDMDLNLVFRWDWETADPDDYEPDEDVPGEALMLFYVGQRKGLFRSCRINNVTDADMPAITEWLRPRWELLKTMWAPIPEGT